MENTQGKSSEHRENSGKTQGILSRLECGHPGQAFKLLIQGT